MPNNRTKLDFLACLLDETYGLRTAVDASMGRSNSSKSMEQQSCSSEDRGIVRPLQFSFMLQFFLLSLCVEYSHACGTSSGRGDLLLCRSCGHEIALETDANFIHSRLALSHRNDTVIGDKRIPVQLFENPQGYQFEVITFKKADVRKHWPAEKHFTWFPGYSWTIATCPRCRAHLGWAFQPSEWPTTINSEQFEDSPQTFVALIIQRLLREHFASSLLVIPKSFRS